MDQETRENLNLALLKIARKTGEDEDYYIFYLKDISIEILEEKIEFTGRFIRVYISEPYNEHRHNQLLNSSHIEQNLVSIFNLNGREFIKYPIQIERYKVEHEIFEDLKEEHNSIKDTDLNEDEWISIQDSNLWKECQIQVFRELIARKIIKQFEIPIEM